MANPSPEITDSIDEDLIQRLPKDIVDLNKFCNENHSKYSFIFSMAYCFGSNICKEGSFFRFKLALMSSLVSQNEEPKNNCSLLAICDDDLVINRLFYWAANLAKKRFVYSSSLHSLTGNLTSIVTSNVSDSFANMPFVVDYASQPVIPQPSSPEPLERLVNSGSLDMAANGIHMFSTAINLDSLSRKEKAFLEHALESNEIIPRELIATTVEISESKLKSIIWANIDTNEITNSDPLSALLKRESGSSSKSNWADLFGTVIVVRAAGLHLPGKTRQLKANDWQQYFELCNSIDPILSPEAEFLVRQYFLLNRQYRSAATLKAKAISILFLHAKCLAKLNLRRIVTKHDAILAVMLYEQQLNALFPGEMSPIVFPFRDLTHIVDGSASEEQLDTSFLVDSSYMDLFEHKLMDCCLAYQSSNCSTQEST